LKVNGVSKTQAQPPLLVRLADFLCANQDRLAQDWMEAVLHTPEIPSANKISHEQLVDHLPRLCLQWQWLIAHWQ
jgi:hypothetical protein